MAIPRPDLSKLTETEKDALIYALLDRIDRQEERIKELERRLGLNSGNSGKPPSSDGYGKKPAPKNLREKTGRSPAGRKGTRGRICDRSNTPSLCKTIAPMCAGNAAMRSRSRIRPAIASGKCSTFPNPSLLKLRNTASICVPVRAAGP